MTRRIPASIDATLELLRKGDYVADRSLATVLYLALKLGRPLFTEGEAGTGKTEIAKVLAQTLGRRLIRLQCYEGLDAASAVYEWNYARQMIEIRLAEAQGNANASENPYIEPLHVLAAMLQQDDGGARSLLARSGVNVGGLAAAVDGAIARLSDVVNHDVRNIGEPQARGMARRECI